jgi:hypothetical protein
MSKAELVLLCVLGAVLAPEQGRGSSRPAGAAEENSAVSQVQTTPQTNGGSRVKIDPNPREFKFAQENKIPIDLDGHAVRQITAGWKSLWESGASESLLAVQHGQDGSTYVNVVPSRLGKLKLVLDFLYEDCAFEERVVDVDVLPPPAQPQRFILASRSSGGDYTTKVGTVHLDFANFNALVLTPVAFYQGFDAPVPVFADDVVFSVITRTNNTGESPIAFDPGFRGVKPLKVGQALIKATFRGKSAYACVDVMADTRKTSERSDCHDFLPSDLSEAIDGEVKSGPSAIAVAQVAADARGAGHEIASGAQPAPFEDDGDSRVKIALKSPEMKLAQENRVPLNLQGHAVRSVGARWTQYSQTGVLEPGSEGFALAPLRHAEDGSAYVDVVPTKLGKLRLGLLLEFGDCILGNSFADVSVHLPDRDPERLILADTTVRVDYTRKAGTLHLSAQSLKEFLTPVAFYKGVDYPVPITVGDEVAFAVIPRKNQAPPVTYDRSTGEIKTVRPGQALIKATLRGRSAYACVDVMQEGADFSQRSNCNDFLPADLTEPIDEPQQMPKVAGPDAAVTHPDSPPAVRSSRGYPEGYDGETKTLLSG